MANAVSGVQMGTIDLAMTGPTMFEGSIPKMGVFSLPFLFKDESVAERVIDGPLGQSLMGQTPDAGAYVLAGASWGWRETQTANRVIRKPEDFQGLKLRLAPGAIGAMTFKSLGAIPTTIDASELYVAVSQGTVDGFEVPFLSLVASKYYEVIKHVSMTNHGFNPVWVVISKRRLDALPAEHQKVIRDTALELQPAWRKLVVTTSDESRKFIESKGIDVVDTDYEALRGATRGVYDWFKQRTDAAFVDAWLKATVT
jgi:TRAP-type transport system periplasmic protein